MSKLKILLLGGIFSLVGIFNFSSANFVLTSLDGNYYDVSSITLTSDVSNSDFVVDYVCDTDTSVCFLTLGTLCEISYNSEVSKFVNSCPDVIPAGTYSVDTNGRVPFTPITLNIGGNSGGSDEGGNDDTIGNLLPGGTMALSGAISNLTSSINEFIPYVVYIGIGIISALLGFFAIRYLINWIKNNSLSVFRSRRKN